VCDLIERFYPNDHAQPTQRGATALFDAGQIRAILDLYARVPEELITLDASDVATLWANVSALRSAYDDRGRTSYQVRTAPVLDSNLHPIGEIYRLLKRCPDAVPEPSTVGLEFVKDGQLRDTLRMDVSSATAALWNHEYKAATVLAGSVVEALLLWALEEKGGETVVRSLLITGLPREPMNRWGLGSIVQAAQGCKLIDDDTRKQADLAQNYRNLIHPGRQARLQDKCDRGTAYGALSAVDRVAVDLAKAFPP
jgi:hypothetical protein